MRVVLASQEYPPETGNGGIGSQTYLKAHGLAALGHTVTVIAASPDDQLRGYRDGDVNVMRIPSGEERLPAETEAVCWLNYSAEVAASIARLKTREPVDIVDFPEWGAEGFFHLLNRTEWNRIPTVVHLHGPLVMFAHALGWPEVNSEFYRTGTMMESTSLRLADAVFSSSKCSVEWCARHYGLDAAAIPVLHTGVNTRVFRPRAVPKETRPTIIFAGRITEQKGALLLLEAACRLAPEFPGLQLRMLGEGEDQVLDRMRARALAAGLPGLLDLAGLAPAQRLAEEFSRAHIFAAPSSYEGGPGFVYLEAMACALPVVACSGSGAAEVITPEENGILTAPGDLGGLISVLRPLLSNPAERQAMGERGRRYTLAEADSDICLRRIEAFYRKVAGLAAAGGL